MDVINTQRFLCPKDEILQFWSWDRESIECETTLNMEKSEGRSPEFQELQLKHCLYRQRRKCAGLNEQRLLHRGPGEVKINRPKLAQVRATAGNRHFAECQELCRVSFIGQRASLPSVVLGKSRHSANSPLPSVRHSAKTSTRQSHYLLSARLSAKKAARQR
jgi:hypothetical protein